jgi:hypothetical protein
MQVHGDNLRQKETSDAKYSDPESKRLLAQIRPKYDDWRRANEALKGPGRVETPDDAELLAKRVQLFSAYKDFIDQQVYAEKFDSRSNLHSSVLEQFVYYIFRDLVLGFAADALIAKASTFKDIFFLPPNYETMVRMPCARVEKKDHDFAIGVAISARLRCKGQAAEENYELHIPAVAIECKTYLDKTMLEGSSTAAEQLKVRNPNAIYLVVSEWLKLTTDVNLKKFKVDQIYVLRKQKNTDREFRFLPGYVKKPIHLDVVEHLYRTVRTHLCADWEGGTSDRLERGYLM